MKGLFRSYTVLGFFVLLSLKVTALAPFHTFILIDEHRNIPVDSLVYGSLRANMTEIPGGNPNLGFLDAGVWIMLELDESAYDLKNPMLELGNPNLDLVLVYEVKGKDVFVHRPSGDQFDYNLREKDHRFHQFVLQNKPNQLSYILIYVDNLGDQLYIPISLESQEEFDIRDYVLQLSNGLYFGILIFVFLLNVFMYNALKERANFYYLLYILGLFFMQLSLEGYGFELLWPDSPYLANHANPFFASFSVLNLLLFCREFLALRDHLPRVDRAFKYIAWFLGLVLISSTFNILWANQFSILSINLVALMLNIAIIPISLYLWGQGFKAARLFVLAFVLLVTGVFFFILRNFGVLPNNFLTSKALQMGSALEVILLSLAIVDKFKIFKEQAYERLEQINEMRSRANVELENKVRERTSELREQKELVEYKNKEITESITYARRIQSGLLPSDQLFLKMFPGSYVVYLPKDIVSGDFYWIDKIGDRRYFAAVDCTGHGVPGAMVSVLGSNHLNRCLHEHKLRKPGKILDQLTQLMIGSFDKSELTIYDGMDIALCAIDKKEGLLEYAGANNALYYIKDNELQEIKATKQPIGYGERIEPFVNHELPLDGLQWVFVFSDGFADQFGGPKNKKFKYKEFKTLLTEISGEAPDDQKKKIIAAFHDWRGINAQIDDVCIIGIHVPSIP